MNTWGYRAALNFTLRKDGWYFTLGGNMDNRRTRYTLDPKANMNTWEFAAKTELNAAKNAQVQQAMYNMMF